MTTEPVSETTIQSIENQSEEQRTFFTYFTLEHRVLQFAGKGDPVGFDSIVIGSSIDLGWLADQCVQHGIQVLNPKDPEFDYRNGYVINMHQVNIENMFDEDALARSYSRK